MVVTDILQNGLDCAFGHHFTFAQNNIVGGLAKVAKTAGIERESLYRALSPRGNPRFSTLVAVAKAMGLKLTFESAR